MTYYLIALLLVIMGAGARTMFEIAYHALGREHDSMKPDDDTLYLIYLIAWFILMMVADIVLLRNKTLKNRNVYIGLLSAGVLVPVIYKFISS